MEKKYKRALKLDIIVAAVVLVLGFLGVTLLKKDKPEPKAAKTLLERNYKRPPRGESQIIGKIGEVDYDKPSKVPDLNNLTENELTDRLGRWEEEQTLDLSKGLLEYQVELYNIYPEAQRNIRIRELLWTQSGQNKGEELTFYLYVWLEKKGESWKVVDSLFHNSNVEF